MSDLVRPPKPPVGKFQTTEWDDSYGFWVIRDLTEAEWNVKFPPPTSTLEQKRSSAQISRRQFYQALANTGKITEAEALASVQTGQIPSALTVAVNKQPTTAERFAAKMHFLASHEFHRTHPTIAAFGTTNSMTEEEIDAFFAYAVTL